jgi:hypothetical protein
MAIFAGTSGMLRFSSSKLMVKKDTMKVINDSVLKIRRRPKENIKVFSQDALEHRAVAAVPFSSSTLAAFNIMLSMTTLRRSALTRYVE